MPELAEVEYFRKRWDAGLGQEIVAVQLHGEKRLFRGSDPRLLKRQLVRQKLLRSEARGKQMLFHFSGQNWLGIHLGMSGHLRTEEPGFRANTITSSFSSRSRRSSFATPDSLAGFVFTMEKTSRNGGQRAGRKFHHRNSLRT